MTFNKFSLVRASTLEALRSHCQSLIPKMTPDVSKYAPGRYRLWLFHEALLSQNRIISAHFDQRLWDFCQRIYPGSNITLLTFGGEAQGINSKGTIALHRDDTYAIERACGVNLGTATFAYNTERKSSNPNASTIKKLQLNDGDIYSFNCKHQHGVLEHSAERFSLNIWTVRKNLDKYPDFAFLPNNSPVTQIVL